MERKQIWKYLTEKSEDFKQLDAGIQHNILGKLTVLLREERELAVREALSECSNLIKDSVIIEFGDDCVNAVASKILSLEQKILTKLRKEKE